MAQHKQSLERVMEVAFKHRRVATEMATAVLGIEAMIASGIDTNAIVENTNKKVVGRSVAALCHKDFGIRMANAITTIDKVIADEGLTIVAEDKEVTGAPHKQKLNKVVIDEITRRIEGNEVASIVTKAEKVIDELLLIYDGVTKADLQSELLAIKAILNS